MTQEDKELLIKDLCARLPYGVKCRVTRWDCDGEMVFLRSNGTALKLTLDNFRYLISDNFYEVKPYLFPLSSMTEEQKNYIRNRFCYDWDGEPYEIWRYKIDIEDAENLVDWFNENHLDYRGLIPKGLANDATGKNIY